MTYATSCQGVTEFLPTGGPALHNFKIFAYPMIPSQRLAKHLLEQNRHLGQFDVALLDTREAHDVRRALEELDCIVAADPRGTYLTVTCPSPFSERTGRMN
jgi:hypothetical protein